MIKEKQLKILAGITKDDELYFLEVTTERDGKPYFAMSGFTVKPVTLEDAKDRVWDYLTEGELWRGAVQSGMTELGKEEWAQMVIDTDGDLTTFDNSLFDEFVTVEGEEYLFESVSCGQHEEKDLKHYFIEGDTFNRLMKAWGMYHMVNKSTHEIVLPMPYSDVSIGYTLDHMKPQNITGLAMQAITLINAQ